MLKSMMLTGQILCWGLSLNSIAQTVQGEDPVSLHQRVQSNMLPWNNATPVNLQQNQEMPAWLDAKLARFQAKAFSANTDGVLTDDQVRTSVTQDGLRKTCIQDIGSSVSPGGQQPFSRYGPKPETQVVVLRGDLVNICR